MTIEIKELVIKAIVDQTVNQTFDKTVVQTFDKTVDQTAGQQPRQGTANMSANMPSDITQFDQQQLISACVEQVLAVLDRQRQR